MNDRLVANIRIEVLTPGIRRTAKVQPKLITTVVLAAFLGACTRSHTPEVNPNPSHWATVSIDTHELPVVIDKATLKVTYSIENTDCLKLRPVSGAVPQPFVPVDIEVQKGAGGEFSGRVALDHFTDRDYDEQGVCHWEPAIASFTLTNESLTLKASATEDLFTSSREAKRFFSTWNFTSAPRGMVQQGLSNPNALPKGDGERIYPVTIRAKEAIRD
jgi:hypothetical protein